MTPTIKLFRKKFCVRDKLAIDGYALLLLKATVKNLEQFLLSEKQKAREEALSEIEKVIGRSRTLDESFGVGKREATARAQVFIDLQHHISKMKDNKTDV